MGTSWPQSVTNWLFENWLGIIAIPVGIYFSWHYYRKSLRTKAITYTCDSLVLISPSVEPDDKLQISWEGRDVPRVTRTNVAIWNSGTETIEGSSVVASDPLRIEATGGARLLRATVINRTRDVTHADMPNINEMQVRLRFEYLDAKDGLAVEVLHTGEPGSIAVKGTVKGIPTGIAELDRSKWDRRIMGGALVLLVPMMVLVLAIFVTLPAFFAYQAYNAPWPKNLVYGGQTLAFLVLLWLIIRPEIRRGKPQPYRIAGVPDQLAESLGRANSKSSIANDQRTAVGD